MTPDILSDPDRAGLPPDPPEAGTPGPTDAEAATALGISTGPPRPRPSRSRPESGTLVRLRGPRRTIRDTPQEEAERKPLLETLLVGWTGSIVTHGLLVALLILLVLVLPKEKARVAFDTELGSSLGAEDGLDLLGGFDDDLTEPIELESPEPIAEPLLAELEPPILEPDADRLRPDASRPEADPSDGGLGGGEFGIARFGEGLETIRGVEVKVGDPQFTLIWDSAADLDLHVIEPGGAHIYWAQRQGKKGGELDVDDTDGFGPENIYWLDPDAPPGEKVKGRGPSGAYHWYVHYYGPPGGFGGRAVPSRWKVRVKHAGEVSVFEGTLRRINQRSDPRSIRVGPADDVPADRDE